MIEGVQALKFTEEGGGLNMTKSRDGVKTLCLTHSHNLDDKVVRS